MAMTLSRRILVLVVTILMALTMVAGPVASGADAKGHKDNPTQIHNNGWGDGDGGGQGHHKNHHKNNVGPPRHLLVNPPNG